MNNYEVPEPILNSPYDDSPTECGRPVIRLPESDLLYAAL